MASPDKDKGKKGKRGKRVKVVDAPPPGMRAEFEYAAEEAALSIVDLVVHLGGQLLYSHYLKEREVPFVSRQAIDDVFRVLSAVHLAIDAGEPVEAEPEAAAETQTGDESHDWALDAEPPAAPVDAWARGAIPLKLKPKPTYPYQQDQGGGAANTSRFTPSESGTAYSGGGSRKPGRGPRAASVRSRGSNKSKMDKLSETGSSEKDAAAAQPIITRLDSPSSRPRRTSYQLPAGLKGEGDSGRAAEMVEIEQKEKAEAARREQVRQDQLAELARQERLAKELKGKEYTYDKDGSVIVIAAVNPDKMPKSSFNIDVRVQPNEDEQADSRANRRRQKRAGGGQARSRRGRKDGREADFFRVSESQQPSMLSNIILSPGVRVTEGASSKGGPSQSDNPSKMSRKDFIMHQTFLETQSLVDAEGVQPLGVEAPTTAGINMQSAAHPAMGGVPGSPLSAQQSLEDPSLAEGGGAAGAGVMADDDDPNDYNLHLIRAADWGQPHSAGATARQPAVLPQKPTSEKREARAMVGSAGKHPRDRPFIITHPRKHLPAPPVGQTIGHGLTPQLATGSLWSEDSTASSSRFLPALSPQARPAGGGGADSARGPRPEPLPRKMRPMTVHHTGTVHKSDKGKELFG